MNDVSAAPLERLLPPDDAVDADSLLEGFIRYVEERGLDLYPAQEEAILEIFAGRNVILNTPTGSGKSLVASAMHYKALAEGARAFYTAPIKALVSEKFFDLCRELGPDNVGMMTGDASVNRDASIICCTAEILASIALREGARADVGYVCMDEFHYYSDADRGVAWQIPLLELPQARFLLMSATLGDTKLFEERLTERTGAPTVLVKSTVRPVPLDFTYRETPLEQTIAELVEAGRAPIYVVHFTQRQATEQAQALMSLDVLGRDEKQEAKRVMGAFRFDSPFGKDLRRWVHHGIGVHHAGLLPKYRRLVERLAQQGLLKIICGTDTLGVGVNIPIRTVLFTQLCKFDGRKTRVLSVRHFQQIAGRAGRRGFDEEGFVVAQAPEHVIENKVLREKTGGDPKKLRKVVFKKPPEKGFASWDEAAFRRLVESEPEKLESRFSVSHGMLLAVLSREDGCASMKSLLRRCHETPHRQRQLGRQAIAMLRSLLEAGVVELVPREHGAGSRVRVSAELQEDFSLNQTLSLFVVEAIGSLDQERETYALDVLTLVEATLEDPGTILLRQVDKLKREALARMKAEGLEYDERMKELDEIHAPAPNADALYAALDAFAKRHPWVVASALAPKSVARDMAELGMTFREYVKEYGLERSEGLLLRYLSDAYKALRETVPDAAKTAEVDDLEVWLRAVVRGTDSSLLDEWEALVDPERVREALAREGAAEPAGATERAYDLTADTRAFGLLVRNAAWRLVSLLARGELGRVAEIVRAPEGDAPWTADSLAAALAPYWEEHTAILTDADARSARFVRVEPGPSVWTVTQTLRDPEGYDDGVLVLDVDLAASREQGEPVLVLRTLASG